MNKKTMSIGVGAFVVGVVTMTIAFTLFLSGGGFNDRDVRQYDLLFESSIKGLNIGAPVTLRGVTIGEVTNIKTTLFSDHNDVLNVVRVDIYPDTISQEGSHHSDKVMDDLIEQGIKARLDVQSFLTGLLYVEVNFYPNPAPILNVTTQHPQIPTVPNNLEEILQEVENINIAEMAARLNQVLQNLVKVTDENRLHKLIINIDEAFVGMEAMSYSMSDSMSEIRKEFAAISEDTGNAVTLFQAQLPPMVSQLNDTLQQLGKTLVSIEDTVAPDSPMMYQLQQSAKQIEKASRAVGNFADMLENEPDALIFGREQGDLE